MGYRELADLEGQMLQGRSSIKGLYSTTNMIFFSHRIRRGGLRLLLQVIAFLFATLLLLPLLPRTSWLLTTLAQLCGNGSRNAGNLRIVVFGSQDMLGSSSSRHGLAWTKQLCNELDCYSHLSFVPKASMSHGLTSNDIYANELELLEQRMNTTDFVTSPASDYGFVLRQYPVAEQTPDLEAQMQEFLSRPPEPIAPRNTLWVFTFGTWDVWNLAALPSERGQEAIDNMVSKLFAQVEVLYRNALDPASVAYSDFWSGVKESDVQRLTDIDAPAKVDLRELEGFRIVIPELLDVTLSPGWQTRPHPQAPHSRATQMRNAAILTRRWNARVQEELRQWTAKGSIRPGTGANEGVVVSMHVARASSVLEFIPAALRFGGKEMGAAGSQAGLVYAPYPRRAGIQTNSAATVVDAMMVDDMEKFGLRGRQKYGKLRVNAATRPSNLWTSCPPTGDNSKPAWENCPGSEGRLFQDDFTLSGRAVKDAVRAIAERVSEKLLISDAP